MRERFLAFNLINPLEIVCFYLCVHITLVTNFNEKKSMQIQGLSVPLAPVLILEESYPGSPLPGNSIMGKVMRTQK